MQAPYPPPPSVRDQARGLLVDLRALLNRAEAILDQVTGDPTGVTYSRSPDEPASAELPTGVQGFAPTGRRYRR